jgi:hypothetical protein
MTATFLSLLMLVLFKTRRLSRRDIGPHAPVY